jgi:AraC family transcriptional regulator
MENSKSEYELRMQRVYEYIDRNIDQQINLNTLAQVANFSPFHFHRIFQSLSGERLGDFIWRRRIELAAMRYSSQPKLTVTELSLAVGFSSVEAFSRSFKARFGLSPTQWIKQLQTQNSNLNQLHRNLNQANKTRTSDTDHSNQFVAELAMKVSIDEVKEIPVAYLRWNGAYGEVIGKFWGEVYYPWAAQNNLLGRDRFGISQDDPTITSSNHCRYDAAVAIQDSDFLIGNYHRSSIAAGKYAKCYFEGTSKTIGAAWDNFLRSWLPTSGLQLDNRPCFEHYPLDGKYDPQTGMFSCYLCMPVTPL